MNKQSMALQNKRTLGHATETGYVRLAGVSASTDASVRSFAERFAYRPDLDAYPMYSTSGALVVNEGGELSQAAVWYATHDHMSGISRVSVGDYRWSRAYGRQLLTATDTE